ncbi:Hsp70 family protein [Roseobacter cerasinus]|uniref:Hsp70 family protein n=1 Tax=Roseobacter cerasinus TaxID=2602289 RepID=UPI00157756AC|nr:Hsp70 family protein [Roseobacter cerasinus]
MQDQALAIDFGTSNTAAALLQDGAIHRLAVEDGQPTLPTAVFFPADEGPMKIGSAAITALIDGEEGRFMRALKSVLGDPLLHERRLISGRRRSVAEIITAFLQHIRQSAERQTGQPFRRALSGRPVQFHSADPAKDAQAEVDLRHCYHAAGFEEVSFLAEPEAAALAAATPDAKGHIRLIVDIGGGTSDFTVVRQDAARTAVLASHGLRLGGTDFDRVISVKEVMPHLGLGSQLRREMGDGLLSVPTAPFIDLATWAKIPFLYTPATRRMAADMLRLSCAPEQLGRFAQVLDLELGHDIAFAVEAGKISATTGSDRPVIDLSCLADGLALPVTASGIETALSDHQAQINQAVRDTLARAAVRPDDVAQVVLVGGSSLMSMIDREVRQICPAANIACSDVFTAVVDGLALATGPSDKLVRAG